MSVSLWLGDSDIPSIDNTSEPPEGKMQTSQVAVSMLCFLLLSLPSPTLKATTINASATGLANEMPRFWGIEWAAGSPQERIASVVLEMAGPGFFDFDGAGNYQNQTAPIVDAGSSLGLTAGDVSFLFDGVNPSLLRIAFAPAAFAPGDRLQFAADIDGLGSDLGGALGAYGGVRVTVNLADSRTGVANFRTDTSLKSNSVVELAPLTVPERGGTFCLLLSVVLILYTFVPGIGSNRLHRAATAT